MAESEFVSVEQEQTAQKHLPSADTKPVAPPFAMALYRLVPSQRHREIQALLGNRVTRQAIQHWLKGRRAPPQWARDIVAERIAEIAALGPALQAHNRRAPLGAIGTMALRRYRAQKGKSAT